MSYVWRKLELSWNSGDSAGAKAWSRYYDVLERLTDQEYDLNKSAKTPIMKDG